MDGITRLIVAKSADFCQRSGSAQVEILAAFCLRWGESISAGKPAVCTSYIVELSAPAKVGPTGATPATLHPCHPPYGNVFVGKRVCTEE